MKIKVSVIVPFYNTQRYLKRCLNSIAAQTFRNYEIILIDDGSTDNSYKIAKTYQSKFNNFKLYKQNNKGIAHARNTGLSMAEGEYIAFIDSDDFIDNNYLKRMVYEALRTNADVVCCNFYWVYRNKILIKNYVNCKIGLFSNMQALNMIISDTFMQSYLWNKLCKRDLFISSNIKFPNMYFEDIATSFKIIYYANKVYVMKDALYYYTQRADSILHSFSFETQNDYLRNLMIIKKFLNLNNIYFKTYKAYNFLSFKISFVIIVSLFLIHLKQRSFSSLCNNYKSAFKFIRNCHKNIFNKKDYDVKNFMLFR